MEKLTRDPRILLLEKMEPIAVVQVCQTNAQFRYACNSEGTFERLLKVHYPKSSKRGQYSEYAPHQEDFKNARDFYNYLTSERGSWYLLEVHSELNDGNLMIIVEPYALYITYEEHRKLAHALNSTPMVNSRGLKLPRGIRYVYGMAYHENLDVVGYDSNWMSFDTLEEAVDDLLKSDSLYVKKPEDMQDAEIRQIISKDMMLIMKDVIYIFAKVDFLEPIWP